MSYSRAITQFRWQHTVPPRQEHKKVQTVSVLLQMKKKSILLLMSQLCIYLFCYFSFIQKTVVIQPNMTIRQLALQMDLDPGCSLIEINFNRLKLVILLELKECQFLLALSKISFNLLLID